MAAQCILFQPQFAALDDENAAAQLKTHLITLNIKTEVLAGQKAICELALTLSGYGNGCNCWSCGTFAYTFCR